MDTAKKLSEKELENITGGTNMKHLILGGIVSLLTVGGGAMLSGTAYAELNATMVSQSFDDLQKVNESVTVEIPQETTKSTITAAVTSTSDASTSVTEESTKTQHTEVDDLKLVQASKEKLDEALDTNKSTDETSTKLTDSKQNTDKKIVETRIIKEKQKLYAYKALNLQDSYALLQSNVIKNFRLYGNLSKINTEKIENEERRKHVEDEGDTLSEILFQLFPSSSGYLNTSCECSRFSFSKKPITPKLMAKFCAILNDYRNEKIVRNKALIEESQNDEIIYFDPNFQNDDKNKFLKFYGLDEIFSNTDRELISLNVDIMAKEAEISKSNEQIKGPLKEDLKENFIQKKETLTNTKNLLKSQAEYLKGYNNNLLSFISMLMDTACDSKDLRDSMSIKLNNAIDKMNTAIIEINNATLRSENGSNISTTDDIKLIKNVKATNYKKIKKLNKIIERLKDELKKLDQFEKNDYPKYLTEKILMSYLIKTLSNSNEVKEFYSELTTSLAKNKSYKIADTDDSRQKIDGEISRLNHIKKVIDAIQVNLNSPYKNKTYENGSTLVPTFNKETKKVTFSGSCADCAETAVRHIIINLLSYSEDTKWDLLLKEINQTDLNQKLNNIKHVINHDGSVELYDFKTRLQIFFLYQSKDDGADDHSEFARTLWEYAIFNMTKENIDEYNKNKTETNQMYPINYCKNTYELDTGYINMLKLMYNIALVLPGTNNDKKLSAAKTSIDNLEKTKNIDFMESTIKDVFSLFQPEEYSKKLKITLKDLSYSTDVFGKVHISKSYFTISQESSHAKVAHNPNTFHDSFVSLKSEDDFVKLLLNKISPVSDYDIHSEFYNVFSGKQLVLVKQNCNTITHIFSMMKTHFKWS